MALATPVPALTQKQGVTQPKAAKKSTTPRRAATLQKPSKTKSKVAPRKARLPLKSAFSDIYDSGLDLVPSKKKAADRMHYKQDAIDDLAAINFKPWEADSKGADLFPSDAMMADIVSTCRISYRLMTKSKEELADILTSKMEFELMDKMVAGIAGDAERLKMLAYMMECCFGRLLVSAAHGSSQ